MHPRGRDSGPPKPEERLPSLPEPECTGSAGRPCEEEDEDGGVPPQPSQAGIPGVDPAPPGDARHEQLRVSRGCGERSPASAEPRGPPPPPACPGRMCLAPPLHPDSESHSPLHPDSESHLPASSSSSAGRVCPTLEPAAEVPAGEGEG